MPEIVQFQPSLQGPLARFCLPILEAPGRVELPTNGLGNEGFHPLLSWLIHLRVGTSPLNWGQAPQTAVIWQQVLGYLALITDETSCARQVVSRDRRRARPPPHLMVLAEAAVVPAKSPARMVNTSARPCQSWWWCLLEICAAKFALYRGGPVFRRELPPGEWSLVKRGSR